VAPYCPTCGQSVIPGQRYCGDCGQVLAPGVDETLSPDDRRGFDRTSTGDPTPDDRTATPPSHTARNVAIVIVVLLVFLLLPPIVPHSFSQAVTPVASFVVGAGGTQLTIPMGSWVTGNYTTFLGISAFVIVDSSGAQVYNSSGQTGSFNFLALNAPYYAVAICVCLGGVTVSGTYYSQVI
jgi:hypothetical protein